MKRTAKRALVLGAITLAATAGYASIAAAQSVSLAAAQTSGERQTPKGWNYEIKDGRRVPKSDRVTNADGSWREEMRQGNCVTIKQKSAAGEYKETRQCDPQ